MGTDVVVGQRRLYGEKALTAHAVSGSNVFTCRDGDEDTDGYRHDGGCCWFGVGWFSELRLIDIPAAAPLAADRCEAPEWCGLGNYEHGTKRQAAWHAAHGIGLGPTYINRDDVLYCSETCIPPLAAQPAETHKCEFWCGKKSDAGEWLCGCNHADNAGCACPCHAQPAETKPIAIKVTIDGKCPMCSVTVPHDHIHVCGGSRRKGLQPAPQPAPAKLPVCGGCGAEDSTTMLRYVRKVTKPVLRCNVCMHSAETAATEYRDCGGYEPTAILRDPAIPERLGRPKLAHSYGVEDDCLPEAGR